MPDTDAAIACLAGDGQLLHVPSPDWRDQVINNVALDRFDDGDPTRTSPRAARATGSGCRPGISTDRDAGTDTFFYEGARFGVHDWQGTAIYVTTWGRYGEGDYLEIRPEPGDWSFGGAEADAPKIMDDALIQLTGAAPDR